MQCRLGSSVCVCVLLRRVWDLPQSLNSRGSAGVSMRIVLREYSDCDRDPLPHSPSNTSLGCCWEFNFQIP